MTQSFVPLLCALWLAAASLAAPAFGQVLAGDLNGDGTIDATDETLFVTTYYGTPGDTLYDPAADLDASGVIDASDLALLAVAYGQTGGALDTTAPDLVVTLNDVPDDMNDLLVVPPDEFEITVLADSAGGSLVSSSSLQISSSEDIGATLAGTELAPFFAQGRARSIWQIPLASDLARTSHYLTVTVADEAGNSVQEVYGFAVRDFGFGAPFENPQVMFLDFDQDRSLGPEIDFIEDMREFGLSSTTTPVLESDTRDVLVQDIVARVGTFYGYDLGGAPGTDPVNLTLTGSDPGGLRARICVGGESFFGSNFLGAVPIDVHNVDETEEACDGGGLEGVFPNAIDDLWSGDPEFQSAFGPLDSGTGGTPFGEDPLDAIISAPGFDPGTASAAELARYVEVQNALDAFAQAVAVAAAHEMGHSYGLTAPGDAPAGLFGGSSGAKQDHNVDAGGATPTANYLMNQGGSFTFGSLIGRAGHPLPVFRTLNGAYLRNRIVVNSQVTGLFPPPVLTGVTPNPAIYPTPFTGMSITIHGDGFLATPAPPVVQLITDGDPTPNPVSNIQWIDPQTLTGDINPFTVPAATYDVRLFNSDGQVVELLAGLVVQVP